MSNNTVVSQSRPPHIALFPSAGMGHLTPFLRIASTLLSLDCTVTLITARPTVSEAESSHISLFVSEHPKVNHVDFQTVPSGPTATTDDPFFLQFDAIGRSVTHVLGPILARSSPPLSALFADIALISSTEPVASELGVPSYVVSTSSVRFLCFATRLPSLLADPGKLDSNAEEVDIPGLTPLPISSVPPPFKNPNHLFTSLLVKNVRAFSKAKGIFVNCFEWFEPEALEATNSGRVLESLPNVLPIGPLRDYEDQTRKQNGEREKYMSWLDNQPNESVVYVSFGSRTAMSREQIREVSKGLEISGYRFIWVLKSSKVDKADEEEVRDLLDESFLERTKYKGLALKGWVRQKEILEHRAVGAFVNHCGWNSVTEAAWCGVPMVAWPQHGDQRVNAEVWREPGWGYGRGVGIGAGAVKWWLVVVRLGK